MPVKYFSYGLILSIGLALACVEKVDGDPVRVALYQAPDNCDRALLVC